VKLSVPDQNPAGESPDATSRISPRITVRLADGSVTVATLPRVAGHAVAAASGSMSADAPMAFTNLDNARRALSHSDPPALFIPD
jgi:hypothetical protein